MERDTSTNKQSFELTVPLTVRRVGAVVPDGTTNDPTRSVQLCLQLRLTVVDAVLAEANGAELLLHRLLAVAVIPGEGLNCLGLASSSLFPMKCVLAKNEVKSRSAALHFWKFILYRRFCFLVLIKSFLRKSNEPK